MTNRIYSVASSIDGFIATPEDDLDWLLRFGFEEFQEHYDAFFARIGALVMGSATYEFIRASGPDAWSYGELPVWVLTTRELEAIEGANVTFVEGDVGGLLARIDASAGGKDVWIVGGGPVAAQFAAAAALDELWLTVMPVVLGEGKPLLPLREIDDAYRLVGTTPFPSGAVELRYAIGTPAGQSREDSERSDSAG
ncbi:dihydrofolate reductase family protein [Plantibacter sp. YIM 135249]|uniref:dihydrofolate reductase family protein n=1 Tax=Plantibacter sp. YIM 135249 TaxID=3423918 RepID=UPI003D352533